jgi:adenosylcobinamide hydrolase
VINADLGEFPQPELVDVGTTPGALGACLVWRLPRPMLAISSSMLGGGLGEASWVLNMTVDPDYSRMDPVEHLCETADRLGLTGRGIGLMTAVDVGTWTAASQMGASVSSTVGVRRPVWAADLDAALVSLAPLQPGTINLVASVPTRLSDAALVNAVATVTEAKVQALANLQVPGTGTASDALCVLCPIDGAAELFGGPRSTWGGRLALATYDAVSAGIVRQRA